MEEISPEQAARAGIHTLHQRMDNGEYRYRLTGGDGSGYIHTEAGETGAWQNSHVHTGADEMYIVQRGWMDLALWEDGALRITRHGAGDALCVRHGTAHNVRPGPGAILHTVKYGDTRPGDWHAVPALDEAIRRWEETRGERP